MTRCSDRADERAARHATLLPRNASAALCAPGTQLAVLHRHGFQGGKTVQRGKTFFPTVA
jgi:hypothetical protein